MCLATVRSLVISFVFISFSFNSFANSGTDQPASGTPVISGCVNSETLFNTTASTITNSHGTTYDLWYAFTVPAGVSAVSISVTPVGNSNSLSSSNTYIEAFNASTYTAFSASNSLGTSDIDSGLNLSNLSATTYFFRVFTTTSPSTGNSSKWTFNVCFSTVSSPVNDNCSGATSLTSSTTCTSSTSSSLVGATNSNVAVNSCVGTADDDVWFKFAALGSNTTIN